MSDTLPEPPGTAPQSERALRTARWAAFLPLVAFGAAYLLSASLRSTLAEGTGLLLRGDLEGLRAWGASLGPWGPLATTLLMIVQAIAAPIPAVLVTWTNSLLFGPFWGGVLSIVSATLAAVLCFLLARAIGEPLVRRLVGESVWRKTNTFVERHGIQAILIARLVPVVPFDPISYVAGLSRMRLRTFAWATLVGQVPAGMTYSYLGQEIDEPARFVLFGLCAALALLLLGWTVRRSLLGARSDGDAP